jgi:diguanylate cyclase
LKQAFDKDTILTARMGGDEFSVLFETTETESILDLLERFRAKVSKSTVPEHPNIQFTVSIGVAICKVPRIGSRTLLTHADQQLYLAKGAGRNQVAHMTLHDSDQRR